MSESRKNSLMDESFNTPKKPTYSNDPGIGGSPYSTITSPLTHQRAVEIKLDMIDLYISGSLENLTEEHYLSFENLLSSRAQMDPADEEVREVIASRWADPIHQIQILNFLESLNDTLKTAPNIDQIHGISDDSYTTYLSSPQSIKLGLSSYPIEITNKTQASLKKINTKIQAMKTTEEVLDFLEKKLAERRKKADNAFVRLGNNQQEMTEQSSSVDVDDAKPPMMSFNTPLKQGLISVNTQKKLKKPENMVKVVDSHILTDEQKNKLLEYLLAKPFSYQNSRLVAILVSSAGTPNKEQEKQVIECLKSLEKTEERRWNNEESKEWIQEVSAGLLKVAKYLHTELESTSDAPERKVLSEKFEVIQSALKDVHEQKQDVRKTLENIKKNTIVSKKRGVFSSTAFAKVNDITAPECTPLTSVAKSNKTSAENLATHCVNLRKECAKREQDRKSCVNLTIGLLESVEQHIQARLKSAWFASSKEILKARLSEITTAKERVLSDVSGENQFIFADLASKDCMKKHLSSVSLFGGKTETIKLLETGQALVACTAS